MDDRELIQNYAANRSETAFGELVARHYPETTFYRLDPELSADIEMDDTSRIGDLQRMGEQFAAQIDWNAMLRGDDTPFRVPPIQPLPRAA